MDKSSNHGHKVGFSLAKHAGEGDSDEDHGFTSPGKNEAKKSKPSANYMDTFKNLLDNTESSPKEKSANPAEREPSAADLILLSKKQPTAGEERENAERVDALLMELFPERYEKKKQKAPKAGKKNNAGYSKNQVRVVYNHMLEVHPHLDSVPHTPHSLLNSLTDWRRLAHRLRWSTCIAAARPTGRATIPMWARRRARRCL